MQTQSVLTNKELIELSQYKIEKLAIRFAGMSHMAAMEFRKQIQIGMANYRETRGYNPVVLENLVGITAKLEKWCKQAFMRHTMKDKYTIMTPHEKVEINKKWEAFCKKNSY